MEEENVLCDEDKSDTDEALKECERELHAMQNEKYDKRPRESDGSSEEGFITVCKTPKRPKHMSGNSTNTILEIQDDLSGIEENKYEVCLFSTQVLPKQMGLARLLKGEGITNICKIKYKSSFKTFITFNDRKQAENLLINKKIAEMDIRSQLTDESNLSYGIIRGVDLDMSEKELMEVLSAPCDIISVKRMKRVNYNDKWEDCETVRLGFKSKTIPPSVDAFGCKFDVEKFVFPVTQCSNCWKFGHVKKFCSLNRIICPKCGESHNNCETMTYKCPNCKGAHMALSKICPFFLKEKEIRYIMSNNNITYKKALELFLKDKKKKEREQEISTQGKNGLPSSFLSTSRLNHLRT
ncbi:uncharacterized protein LOC135074773 [Ostrinia nubilalis]|uniref:uncharacterized protein LOC135074773 n=1 Tax=Ostrinia nubilalis TaxID=29057 RepID=UPI0030825D34